MLLTPTVTLLNQGAVWSPLRLPGLAAWYDASDSATVLTSVGPDVPATDGQTVRRWLDKSGNARHLDQGTLSQQPAFNSAGTFLRATNAGQTRMSATFNYAFPLTAFIVFRRYADSPSFDGVMSGNVAARNELVMHPTVPSTIYISPIPGTAVATTMANFGIVRNRQVEGTGTHQGFYNGASVASGNLAAQSFTTLNMFCRPTANTTANSDVCEFLMYGADLATADAQRIEQYLQRKWGTPALP